MYYHVSHINHIIHTITHSNYNITVTPITTPLKSTRIEEIVQEWYADFVDVDQIMLFELVTAANFMDIKALLDLTCLAVSVLIKVSDVNGIGLLMSLVVVVSISFLTLVIFCLPSILFFSNPPRSKFTGKISRRDP